MQPLGPSVLGKLPVQSEGSVVAAEWARGWEKGYACLSSRDFQDPDPHLKLQGGQAESYKKYKRKGPGLPLPPETSHLTFILWVRKPR